MLVLCALLTACDLHQGDGNSGSKGSQDPDPVAVDAPIAYVARPLPKLNNGNAKPDNILMPADFNPGAKLMFKARATASTPEVAITEAIFPPQADTTGAIVPQAYDVKDLFPSRDGKKLLCALRAPRLMNGPEELQPTWDIWEYDRIKQVSRPIITDPARAQLGQDVQPAY